MSPEPEQNAPGARGEAGVDAAGVDAAGVAAGEANAAGALAPAAAAALKPRTGVPVWRTGKPDAVLAAAVDVARAAVETIAAAEQIGGHLGARSEGDRLVTHLFESKLAGYGGWQWYAVLTRNSRSKVVTVSELGLLPSEDSILAPEWVPWAERVRPEDAQDEETAEAAPAASVRDAEPDTENQDVVEPAELAQPDAAAPDTADADTGDGDAAVEYDDEDYGVNDAIQPVLPADEVD